MRKTILNQSAAIAVGVLLILAGAARSAGENKPDPRGTHQHTHTHETKKSVYDGYFEDNQIKARSLSDWEGEWQSVYPYLLDGTLDPVLAHKAEKGDKTAEEYRDYYGTGYKTDVGRVVIQGDDVTFYRDSKATNAKYATDGYEIQTYKKGNRGVRFIFKKTSGDEAAPVYLQFSDHIVAPEKAGHYHLYWGNDRAGLLKEITNWPTYYPANLSAKQIVDEMLAH